MTNLLPFAIAWGVLAVIVLSLALMRRSIASQEDDTIHLGASGAAIDQQVSVAKKLESIDRWGKILTVVLAVSGVALAILYGMQIWDATSRAGLG